jgi:DNA gyrase/topoisomerase IV subunit A
MGRRTSGRRGHEVPRGDSVLSMSVIRAEQVAQEELAAVKPQYVFTITDGGFAKRSRITDYRLQSRGGLGIKTMSLANEERGNLVGRLHRRSTATRCSRSPRVARSCAARSTTTSGRPGVPRWA